jgi:hypothetical protein
MVAKIMGEHLINSVERLCPQNENVFCVNA